MAWLCLGWLLASMPSRVSSMAMAAAPGEPAQLAAVFAHEVAPRLVLPPERQQDYAAEMELAFSAAGVVPLTSQYVVLVDRNPNVQALLIFWRSSTSEARFIGAAPVSTGRHGGFEHFETPCGVFEHSLASPDFRAEGTRNELGVRGYGLKGMRVYDFGNRRDASASLRR